MWKEAAAGAAQGVATGAVGALIGNSMQKNAEKRQVKYSKDMAKFMHDLEMKKWRDTNYSAQMNEMRKAGLSAGMMYGGVGGASMVSSTSSPGNSINTGTGGEAANSIVNAMSLAKLQSEIELNKSQANKNNADADYTGGAQTDETKKRIESLTQGIKNQQAIENMTKVQTRLFEMEEIRQDETLEESIDRIKWEAKQAKHYAKIAEAKENVDTASIENNKKIIQEQAIYGGLLNTLTKANINKTNAEIGKIATEITTMISNAAANTKNASSNSMIANAIDRNSWNSEAEALVKERLQKEGLNLQETEMYLGLLKSVIGAGAGAAGQAARPATQVINQTVK